MDVERLAYLVQIYPRLNRSSKWDWEAYFRRFGDTVTAIRQAALSDVGEGRHPHQWRISPEVLNAVAENLASRLPEIVACQDFDSLVQIVAQCRVPGFGPLCVYDTAQRIGWNLGLYPEKVYLHAGTLTGARRLGLDVSKGYLLVDELPPPLQSLPPDQIEDFLCINKDRFIRDE